MIGSAFAYFVAALHVVFFIVESVLWDTPAVRKRFGMTPEQAAETKVLAATQGVYNGALAAALVWSIVAGNKSATLVLLGFVVVVGIYGGFTAKRSILVLQALPAAIALALVWAGL